MEEEFIQNQERLKPQEEKQEVYITVKSYEVINASQNMSHLTISISSWLQW